MQQQSSVSTQAFTALLNHWIPEQKTLSDHKPLQQQRLKLVTSHTKPKVFAPQFTDTANKLSLTENWMSHQLVLTEMPNLTLYRKIQSLWEIRNCMKAKMLQKKTPNLWEHQKSKNKRQSKAPDKFNYVRVHPTTQQHLKWRGVDKEREKRRGVEKGARAAPAVLNSATKQCHCTPHSWYQFIFQTAESIFLFICKLHDFTSSKYFPVLAPSML